MANGEFETTGIKAPTVVSWIAGILSITVWLGWAALANRIERLETGGAPQMSETLRIQFDTIERARVRIDNRFDRIEERLNATEQRVRALEAVRDASSPVRLAEIAEMVPHD